MANAKVQFDRRVQFINDDGESLRVVVETPNSVTIVVTDESGTAAIVLNVQDLRNLGLFTQRLADETVDSNGDIHNG